MIELRLRRLVYKADIFGVHANRYSKYTKRRGYKPWSKKKSRLSIRKGIGKRYSTNEETNEEATEEATEEAKKENRDVQQEREKGMMIYEQQMRTNMIYLTPPTSPVFNPKHTWNALLGIQLEPLNFLFPPFEQLIILFFII